MISIQILNDQDIAYYYESRLAGAEAAEGIHFHPIEPRTAHFSYSV